jgi:hypothetical protein
MRRPRGHTAVMADKAPAVVEADTPEQRLHRQLQFFPTPPWAARAGGELIRELDANPGYAWEPACGQGHMVHGLKDYFAGVRRTDIHDYGWDGLDKVQDFLAVERSGATEVDWIVTNPPFGQAAEFVKLGLQRARRGVAVLIRSAWYDSGGRFPLFCGDTPCDVRATFFDRVPMELGGWSPGGSTATSYAWFIWFKTAARPSWLHHVKLMAQHHAPALMGVGPLELSIPPGTKDRLTRPTDARLFGRATDAPLLEGLA